MITRPLELVSRLSPPPRDLDFMAWVNVAIIVLSFGLLGSQFVLAPGLSVGVGGESAFELPVASAQPEGAGAALVVISQPSDDVILFEGGMYSLADLRGQMENYIKTHPGAVMVVRADRQVSLQAFVKLCDLARVAGFSSVRLATESPALETGLK